MREVNEGKEITKENNIEAKLHISSVVRKCIKEENLSIRRFGDIVGLKHPQIHRVLNGGNYNINTLFRILNGLNLEIEVRPRKENDKQ